MPMPNLRRWLPRLLLLPVLLGVLAAAGAWWLLRGSLPDIDGEHALAGLHSPVRIARDALGVVTIDAASEQDALRALGYVHAQERYFEMDLMRRSAAGELSGLFGARAVEFDRKRRVHRMRARVDADLDRIAGDKRPLLQAYTEGVNSGLASLRMRPWPYLLLRQSPAPWQAADTGLTGYAMYFDLQDAANANELALWKLRPHLPDALYRLLTHPGSRWDAPLMGEGFGDAGLPGADQVDLRRLPTASVAATPLVQRHAPGSNNFAVAGALTADGRAIVADDMHLGLRAPNIWFRARLRWPDARAPGGRVDVQGVTLPGLPAVIVGSNGHVAWAYTNSYGDYLDWALQTPCPPDAVAGQAPGDCDQVEVHRERIAVAGGAAVEFEVRETAWGPVLHEQADGRLLALRWAAHQPGSVNLGLLDFARAAGLDAAMALADRTAVPTQNLLVGDRSGRIAWRLLGPLPQRAAGCTPAAPITTHAPGAPASADGAAAAPASPPAPACLPWRIATDASPRVASPPADRLWTANARVAGGEALQRLGDGGYALGARQQQIRDALLARDRFVERDLLDLQLDDRALLMGHWWRLLRERAAGDASPALRALAAAAASWEGRASIDSTSYRIVRGWRLAVHARLLDGLLAPARAAMGDDYARPDLPQFEGVAWPLVQQRPEHLLPRGFASWQALFEDAAAEVRDDLAARGPLRDRSWGEANTSEICHPLAAAVPLLGRRLLCMPAQALPGDAMMPRVQDRAFGASQRMVVAPGHEAEGIMHMPGGQSGHPLSPFWGAGHDDWAQGRPTPFLPGPATHTMVLRP